MSANREYSALVAAGTYPEDPVVPLDAPFVNEAGTILNILLERFTSAAFIHSRAGAIRANHYHRTDWHYSFVVSGTILYGWRPAESTEKPMFRKFTAGQLFFTPPGVEHVMYFPADSAFLTLARNLRDHESHENDVVRVTPLLSTAWDPTAGDFVLAQSALREAAS